MVAAKEKVEEAGLNIHQLIAKISIEAGALVPVMSEGLKFAFRGVNQVVDHLSPHLNKYGVTFSPEILSSEIEMHLVGSRYLTDSKVVVRYTFYAPDGSTFSATTAGYAQDYADRASAQSQSVSMRVALLQTFHLPTSDVEPELNGEKVNQITAEEFEKEAKKAPAAAAETVDSLRTKIGEIISDASTPYDGPTVNQLGDKVTGKSRDDWKSDLTSLKKVYKAILAGEVA